MKNKNPELEALLLKGIPEGTRLCVCGNQGVKVTVEARLWWGFPLQLIVNGKTKTRYGVVVIRKRVNYDVYRKEMLKARNEINEQFPELVT